MQFKVKIRKHGKEKNDKDEIGNIVSKTRFYQSIAPFCRPDPPVGCVNVSLKYKLNCLLSFPKWMLIAGTRILLSLYIAFTDVSSCYFTLSRYHFKWKYLNLKIHQISYRSNTTKEFSRVFYFKQKKRAFIQDSS